MGSEDRTLLISDGVFGPRFGGLWGRFPRTGRGFKPQKARMTGKLKCLLNQAAYSGPMEKAVVELECMVTFTFSRPSKDSGESGMESVEDMEGMPAGGEEFVGGV
jgi:hypothetical protein